jgi:hypothetical protein
MRYDLVGITYDDQNRWTRAAGAPPVMVFSLDSDVEVLYQPVLGQRLVTGQLWVGNKNAVKTCPTPIEKK